MFNSSNQDLLPTKEHSNQKMEQFEEIIGSIVTRAIASNNEVLGNSISDNGSTTVIKEMDYLLRIKEEREEERFIKLDETIRTYQQNAKKGKKKLFAKG